MKKYSSLITMLMVGTGLAACSIVATACGNPIKINIDNVIYSNINDPDFTYDFGSILLTNKKDVVYSIKSQMKAANISTKYSDRDYLWDRIVNKTEIELLNEVLESGRQLTFIAKDAAALNVLYFDNSHPCSIRFLGGR